MRDCEFSEYMIERLYMEAVRMTDDEPDEELDEEYDWRDDPTPTLDQEIEELLEEL